MAGSEVSTAKIILLAVQLVTSTELSNLESLISRNRRTLHTELVLRILLSYLPETLESSKYVQFLEKLESGKLVDDPEFDIARYQLEELCNEEAKKKANNLHLRRLAWPYESQNETPGLLVRFIVLRALRIDDTTGIITELPELLEPFLFHSTFLRTWLISTILPLLRFNYEYHPEHALPLTIPNFEKLDDDAGVKLLLSQTGKDKAGTDATVGRDLRGLVGPWMYGDARWKRRKGRRESRRDSQIQLLDMNLPHGLPAVSEKILGWEDVFKWITQQAGSSWEVAVKAIEQWDGPGDVDVGEYNDGSNWLDENEQQHLERRYARAAMATAYLINEQSEEGLTGIHRIVERIISLLDLDKIPTLQAAAAILSPVSSLDEKLLSEESALHLRDDQLSETNVLTRPGEDSIRLLHALLVSTYICTRIGSHFSIRRAGELALLQSEREQKVEFQKVILHVSNGPKGDDKFWSKSRNEILWLRNWGSGEHSEGTTAKDGRGIFGKLSQEYVEVELLKLLLSNTRYALARSIYETSPHPPLSKKVLVDTIIAAAMNAYDNATNANKTRGGVKKSHDILQAFPDTLRGSLQKKQTENLIDVTHSLGKYRLVFKQGEPFQPVTLRVHGDPISILDKVLEQNPKTYLKIVDLLSIGKGMVRAGLTARDVEGAARTLTMEELEEQEHIAEKRIVSMCIDTACVEEDFETAYSFVVTKLNQVAGPAHSSAPDIEKNQNGLSAEVPPKIIDDWSWRAALQAGKYRRTNFGNGKKGSEVRHLEQRLDCLSQALRLAPKSTLSEIINVFRRCEEELVMATQQETEEAEAWDARGDTQIGGHGMPGGFNEIPERNASAITSTRAAEEAPMSLFDLSRASMARAQTGFSALSILRGNNSDAGSELSSPTSVDGSRDEVARVRKRDQLVGGLASGVGWLIGAPAAPTHDKAHPDE